MNLQIANKKKLVYIDLVDLVRLLKLTILLNLSYIKEMLGNHFFLSNRMNFAFLAQMEDRQRDRKRDYELYLPVALSCCDRDINRETFS